MFQIRPPRKEAQTQLCCMCPQLGHIYLLAYIDRSGYCPGESIVINVECANMTRRKLRGLTATIIRTTTRSTRSK